MNDPALGYDVDYPIEQNESQPDSNSISDSNQEDDALHQLHRAISGQTFDDQFQASSSSSDGNKVNTKTENLNLRNGKQKRSNEKPVSNGNPINDENPDSITQQSETNKSNTNLRISSASSPDSQDERLRKDLNGSGKPEVGKEKDQGKIEEKKKEIPRPRKGSSNIRERVLHMTPSWFTVTMGTGVISTLIQLLPWPNLQPVLRWFALVWLLGDSAIFIIFTLAFLSRYVIFPQVLPLTYKHPQKSMFLGCFPMALTTISGSIALLSQDSFQLSQNWAIFASILWWISGVIGLLTAALVPFSMMSYQTHHFSGTTAALLLPIVPPITTAAVGGTLTEIFATSHPSYAFTILIWSYCVLGVGLPLALLILVLYFQRLMLFRAPSRDIIISVFLPLGPCGQGGEALLHLGRATLKLLPVIHEKFGNQMGVEDLDKFFAYGMFSCGLVSGLLLWGLGAWWAVIGLLTVIRGRRAGRLPFNMGHWAASFPVASFAILTGRIAQVLNSLTFKILFTGLVLINIAFWAFCFLPTVKGFLTGELMLAPCIADLPLDLREGKSQKGKSEKVQLERKIIRDQERLA